MITFTLVLNEYFNFSTPKGVKGRVKFLFFFWPVFFFNLELRRKAAKGFVQCAMGDADNN